MALGLVLIPLAGADVGNGAQGVVAGDILFDLAAGVRNAGLGGAGVARLSAEALNINPACLPWIEGIQITSAYGDVFGAAHLGVVAASVPGLAVAGVVLEAGAVSPGLAFRSTGAAFGAGMRLGPLAAAVRARAIRPVSPVPGLGAALDIGLLWRGPINLGAVWKNAAARSPVPREFWPGELTVGAALSVELRSLTASFVCDVSGIGTAPALAVGAVLELEGLAISAGYGPSGAALGGTVGWSVFDLDWAILLHPVLPPSIRLSLTVRL